MNEKTANEHQGDPGAVEVILKQLHQRVEARSTMGLRLTADSYNYTADDVRWILRQAIAALPHPQGWQPTEALKLELQDFLRMVAQDAGNLTWRRRVALELFDKLSVADPRGGPQETDK